VSSGPSLLFGIKPDYVAGNRLKTLLVTKVHFWNDSCCLTCTVFELCIRTMVVMMLQFSVNQTDHAKDFVLGENICVEPTLSISAAAAACDLPWYWRLC